MARDKLIKVRRGTAAAWTSANPTLAAGEPGLETDTGKFKWGDGSTAWASLAYAGGSGSGVTYGTPAIVLGTSAAAGSTDESIRRDATIVAFDATAPTTQAFGDSAAVGTAAVAARRDHKHAMPAAPTSVSGNAGTATALQTARTIDGQSFDGTANITVIAPGTHAATGKTTPADADEWPIVDSAASNVLKKLTGTNLKAYLKTYFDTIYTGVGAAVTGVDGWVDDTAETWTYASASTFTISGDKTAKYTAGTRLKLTQTTVKYFVVMSSAVAAGTTTVTIVVNTDYVLANAAISVNYHSYMANPQGWPSWFNYAFAPTGFTGALATSLARFNIVGKAVQLELFAQGTSNATTLTCSPPCTVVTNNSVIMTCYARDNGVTLANPGRIYLNTDTQIKVGTTLNSDVWTSSGSKGFQCFFFCELY